MGAADLGFVIVDCHGVGVDGSDEVDFAAGAGDAGVNEVALEHNEVLFEQRDHHYGVFAALALMDTDRIGELDFGKLAFF